MEIKIYIAAHREYLMPEDKMYRPIHAGSALATEELPYIRDDTGDNISALNRNFCELTALYWIWKNALNGDGYTGLCHYRRYFGSPGLFQKKQIIAESELVPMTERTALILPKKRNYFIETTYQQYIHAHHRQDLDSARDILAEHFPDYVDAFDAVMKDPSGHRFNMFIMRNDLLRNYCEWLFDVLFKLRDRLDISEYSDYDMRVFGFVGERLLDVWVKKNGVSFKELPVLNTEKQHWPGKIYRFIMRKISYKE